MMLENSYFLSNLDLLPICYIGLDIRDSAVQNAIHVLLLDMFFDFVFVLRTCVLKIGVRGRK